MPDSPLLDFDALLKPIPGASPAGSSEVYLTLRSQLEEMRKEDRPEDYPPGDFARPETAKYADWDGILTLTRDTLLHTAKDLRLAGYLTEALVKKHGYAGLRDGLRLVRGLVETCWDYLLPAVEDGDASGRLQPLENMLDSPVRGLRLPTAVRGVVLVKGGGRELSYLDWDRSQNTQLATDDVRKTLTETFEKATGAAKHEECIAAEAALGEDLQELKLLRKALEARAGDAAPGLTELGGAVEDCRRLLTGYVLPRIAPPARPGADAETDKQEGQASGAAGASRSAATLASRAEAYQRLAEVAALLKQLEPHSPIPYLLERAVVLGRLPFPQMIKELVRDGAVLGVLGRELGLPNLAEGQQ
jgi:type VI secretion system protein ImpA